MPKIELSKVSISGFATANAYDGADVRVIHRNGITSDHPSFPDQMAKIANFVLGRIEASGNQLNFDNISRFALVIHEDGSADLHLQDFDIGWMVNAKRDVVKGQKVRVSDIADIVGVNFPDIPLLPHDKIIVCLKVDWKFALYFDLEDERDLDVNEMSRVLAKLIRVIKFGRSISAFQNKDLLNRIQQVGWFPFVEIIGPEYEKLVHAHQSDFNIAEVEKGLVEQFNAKRLAEVTRYWWRHEHFRTRQPILEAGLDAFLRGDPISCIKVLVTEIEGIIRDSCRAGNEQIPRLRGLLEYAARQGKDKFGVEKSLMLPEYFLDYLELVTFANFDASDPDGTPSSRHSVGHGAAMPETYTMTRALQVILTLDQLRRYL